MRSETAVEEGGEGAGGGDAGRRKTKDGLQKWEVNEMRLHWPLLMQVGGEQGKVIDGKKVSSC